MSESEEKPATQNKTETEELDNSGDEKQQDDKAKLGDKNKKSPAKSPIKEESKKVPKKPAKKENAETKSEENGDGEKKPAIENVEADTKSTSEKKNKKVDAEDKEDAEEDANAEGSEENDEDEEDEEDDDEAPRKSKALLDLPLEMSGARERKKVERLSVGFAPSANKEKSAEEGEGVKLSEIADFDTNLAKMKPADLKPFHKLLYNRPGSAVEIKKNIRSFKGFPFKAFSSEYDKKKAAAEKCTIPFLRTLCGLVSLDKTGSKEEISQRLIDFLVKPEDSGAVSTPKKKPAPKPKKAEKEKVEKVEKSKPRVGARASSRKTKSKSYAEVSNSDEEAEDEEEEVEEVVEKKAKVEIAKMDVDSGESDEKESDDKDESDDDWDKNKKKSRAPAKKANAKTQSKKEDSRKPSSEKETAKEKKAPARSKAKAKKEAVSEESSDDDEPLAKKSKKPPTDDELKALIKKILDGANLEEITMKTVCKQVYGSFPEFDLADRKEFIKDTVRSIIS